MIQIRGVPEEHRRIHNWVLVAISMWEEVPTPKSNSQTPAGSPTIQLDSDTTYLDEHQIPRVNGSILCDSLTQANHRSSLSLVLLTPLARNQIPITPSLGFSNLLEWLIGPRETIYLLDLLVYYRKDRTQELPDGNDVRGKVWKKAPGLQALSRTDTDSASPCVHQSGHSLNRVLWGFLGGFIIICHWWSIHPPAPLPNFGGWSGRWRAGYWKC